MVYRVKDFGEIQKQKNRNLVLIERIENIVEYANENSLRAVPGQGSRLMNAE